MGDIGDFFAGVFGVAFYEAGYECGNIFFAFAQGGQVDREDMEAVVEIASEPAGLYFFFEVAVGGCDDADVDFDGAIATDAFDLFFLEEAQEFDLEFEGEFTDLIEEEGAVGCQFKFANAFADGPGKAAFFVTE